MAAETQTGARTRDEYTSFIGRWTRVVFATFVENSEKIIASRTRQRFKIAEVIVAAQPLDPTTKELVLLGETCVVEIRRLALDALRYGAALISFWDEGLALDIFGTLVFTQRANIHFGVRRAIERNLGTAGHTPD